KGAWLVFRGMERGASTLSVLGELVNQAIAALPIARRMRWGARTVEFVRPVHTVVLLYGDEVVPVEVLGLMSDRVTRGHRFRAPRPISLKSAKSYEGRLRRAKVVVDVGAGRDTIRTGVMAADTQAGGSALIDGALLDEVTALVEWPVPIVGRFEARFLSLPREVVIATIQDHQRYFAIEGADGKLTGGFVTVSNIESRDPAKGEILGEMERGAHRAGPPGRTPRRARQSRPDDGDGRRVPRIAGNHGPPLRRSRRLPAGAGARSRGALYAAFCGRCLARDQDRPGARAGRQTRHAGRYFCH